MTFTELVEELAGRSETSKKDIKKVLNNLKDVVIETTLDGGEVRLSGFGKFTQKNIKPRKNVTIGKNTGVDIAGKKYPKFKCFDSAKTEY